MPGISGPLEPGPAPGLHSPTEGLPVRWSSLRSMPAAAPVRGRVIGIGANGATAPTGRPVAAGPRPAAERGLCRVPSTEGGGGAPADPAGAVGDSPGSATSGRARTRFQLYLAAKVANLTLVEGKAGLTGDIGGAAIGSHAAWANTGRVAANFGAIRIGQIWPLALLTLAFLPVALLSTKAFHPHF